MRGPVPPAKEALRMAWANIPGVHFAKPEEQPKAKLVRKKKEEVVSEKPVVQAGDIGAQKEDEYTLEEAANVIGIPVQTMWRSLVTRGCVPYRRHRKSSRLKISMYLFKKTDIAKLWQNLCKVKGVPEGTKLGNLAFLAHMPNKERMRYVVAKEF